MTDGDLDPGLLVWEQREWVTLLLKSLPPAQREVLACNLCAAPPEAGQAPRADRAP